MTILRAIFFILLLVNFLNAQIILDASKKEIILLNKSDVFFDEANQESIDSLLQKPELFKPYYKEFINRGIKKEYPAWVKFTIYNSTTQIQHRTLSLNDVHIEEIDLYITKDNMIIDTKKSGSLHRKEFKGILMPNFNIELPPLTQMTYYLKVYSPNQTLSFKAIITTQEDFIYKDIKYHIIWGLFIAILLTVLIYNLLLFFLTKDSIYFYYAVYVLGILATKKVHYLLWLHIFPMHEAAYVEMELSLVVYYTNFTALTMVLFTQHFLKTKQYPKLNKFLNFLSVLIVLHSIITTPTFLAYQDIAIFYLLLLIFFFFVGFYVMYKKNENATYYLFGWGLSIFAWVGTMLHGLNIWNIKYDFYYITETFITLEVFLFSFAISRYINNLNNEKELLTQKLIEQTENEKIKLEKTVEEKTHVLNEELKTNQLLLQELNHRVKNNMQLITSLYALQLGNNPDIKEKLQDVERKVLAMSQVHQMIYNTKDISHIEADQYFEKIVQKIQDGFKLKNISFIYKIDATLTLEEAIYCGLIVNELVTNAIWHAFAENKGEIVITLNEDENFKYLKVKDNGVGMKEDANTGFGHTLIKTLAIKQLNGQIHINCSNGTQIKITFPKN